MLVLLCFSQTIDILEYISCEKIDVPILRWNILECIIYICDSLLQQWIIWLTMLELPEYTFFEESTDIASIMVTKPTCLVPLSVTILDINCNIELENETYSDMKSSNAILLVFIFIFLSFNLWRLFLIITFYYHIKTPIGFWCRRRLNLKSLIQP